MQWRMSDDLPPEDRKSAWSFGGTTMMGNKMEE